MVVRQEVQVPKNENLSSVTAQKDVAQATKKSPQRVRGAAAPVREEPNKYQGLAKRFLMIALALIIADAISRICFPQYRTVMIAAFQGFMTTFTLFGIIPLYFLSRKDFI